jgi:hypothetical protein
LKLIDLPPRNILYDRSTKKFPTSDNKKIRLVEEVFFYVFYSVHIRNIACTRRKCRMQMNASQNESEKKTINGDF